MTPLERAARVFATAYLVKSQSWLEADPYVVGWVNAYWRDFLPHVREVLIAVRDPGQELIARVRGDAVFAPESDEIEAAHASMIDAMLEEAA
ncbi:hypothetical protein FHS51_001755 [Sphingobium wenxiniae]|uniref:Uncharacterized protein n=1 Tax=Sphingobium wenxiniae (strain DSM 21828 / CGMCC 1.7748 / JZ-1) TaxID=595605 RepID=A0A562KD87_SPHWJ|nr:hypothetical protein [Sphingobium wenxiniae]MBB6191528.1 hypothetical protein [Sphingobium wenxiniae]TWH93183.1 hypothetical protein IQ35_02090 [Sphingobium wenxiniae]